MRYFMLLVFLFHSYNLIGQQKQIDSLKNVLENYQKYDDTRFLLFNELSYKLSTFNAQSGLKYADSALVLAKKLNNKKFFGLAFRTKSINQYALGDYKNSKTNNNKAIKLFKKIGDSLNLGKCYREMGKVYIYTSKLDSSEIALKRAEELFRYEGDSLQMAITENILGITFLFQDSFKESLSHFLRASSLFDKLKLYQTEHYASFLSNFGMYYTSIEDYEKSLKLYLNALDIFKKIDQPFSLGNVLNNIGNIYSHLDDATNALKYYKQAYDSYEQVGMEHGTANASVNLGIVYFKLGDYQRSDSVYKAVLPKYKEWEDNRHLSNIYHNLGRNQVKFFNISHRKEHLFRAQEYFNMASDHAKKGGNLLRASYSKTFLADVNSMLGNTEAAKDNTIEAYKIKDSLISYNIMREITETEQAYKNELKAASLIAQNEKDQALAQAEIQSQKQLNKAYLYGGSGILFMSGLGIFFYVRRKKALALKEKAEFETKVAETELKALRAQMNPHFIFNSLNSINNFLLKNDKNDASEYLRKFAHLMRKTLESSDKKEVLLKDDLDLLASYLEIEARRLPNKFDYKFNVDKNVDVENTMVPPLILQPFIENSIWHGIASLEGKGKIQIEVQQKKDTILYVVDDNGIGLLGKNNKSKEKSMGIQLTKNRIAIINATKNQEGDVMMVQKDQGVRVEVEIPLKIAF